MSEPTADNAGATTDFAPHCGSSVVLRPGSPRSVGLDPAPIEAAIDAVRSFETAPTGGHPLYPGAVAMMGHHGRIVATDVSGYSRLYVDASTQVSRHERIAMRRNTIFDMASVSKLFTSIVAVQQMERQTLVLEAPVATYLPDFASNGKQEVTIQHLLTHTSGFTSWLPLYSKYSDKESRLRAVREAPLINPPGSKYLYSDLNMISLAMVVEKITGKSLDVLVRNGITGPLRMRDTGYNPAVRLRRRIAATEFQVVPDRGMVWGEVHDENAWSLDGVAGHAGVFSTADDLAVLSQTLLNGGSYRHARILSEQSVQKLITDYNGNFPGNSHGLGFELDQDWYMGGLSGPHTAGHTGYTGTTIVINFDTGSFALLLTNRVHPSRSWGSINPARVAWANGLASAMNPANRSVTTQIEQAPAGSSGRAEH